MILLILFCRFGKKYLIISLPFNMMFVKITKMQQSVSEVCVCVQVSDHGVLLLELDCGLNFPVTEHLSRLVYRHALHGETRAHMHTDTHVRTQTQTHARGGNRRVPHDTV